MSVQFNDNSNIYLHQLGLDIAHQIADAGFVKGKCLVFSEQQAGDIKDLPNILNNLFYDIANQKGFHSKLHIIADELQDIVAPFFKAQTELIEKTLLEAERLCLSVFDTAFSSEIEKVDQQFKEAIQKIDRENRTLKDAPAFQKDLTNLSNRMDLLYSLTDYHFLPYKSEIDSKVNLYKEQLVRLKSVQESLHHQNLLDRLKILTENKGQTDPDQVNQLKQDLEEFIYDNFAPRLIGQLDEMIYKLSSDPKGGENWGQLHRYDDLGIFRQALLILMIDKKEPALIKEIGRDNLDRFYQAMHEYAFGPDGVDSIAWSKDMLPALVDTIDQVAKKILPLKEENDNLAYPFVFEYPLNHEPLFKPKNPISFVDEFDDFEAKPLLLPFPTDIEFNPPPIDHPLVDLVASDKPEIKALNQLLEQIAQVNNPLTPDGQSFIKTLIKETLKDDATRGSLYNMIYVIAGNKQSGDDRWGENHCADDLNRLYQAIENVKLSLAFEQD